uniref:Uncharacterized protein n=1 Tax=Klebsiella phage vB_KpnM_Iguana_ER37 TaxID=3076781 RepID=A0AB38Z468_9CAUD
MENPCKWHEVPVHDCLTCNNTPTNPYYIKEPKMFGPVMMECKVCKQEFEADLEAHGPGVCIISFGCGHTMHAIKTETRWVNTKTGNVDLVETAKQIKGSDFSA